MTPKKSKQSVRVSTVGSWHGELAPPGFEGRTAARWWFFEVLADQAEEVIDELYQDVTPLVGPLQRFYLSGHGRLLPGEDEDEPAVDEDTGRLAWRMLRGLPEGPGEMHVDGKSTEAAGRFLADVEEEWLLAAERRLAHARALRDGLLSWGSKRRLADDWCMEVALQSVLQWARVPEDARATDDWRPRLWLYDLLDDYDDEVPQGPDPDGRPPLPGETEEDYLKRTMGGRRFPGETEADYLKRLRKGQRWTWAHGPGPWDPYTEGKEDYRERVESYLNHVSRVYRNQLNASEAAVLKRKELLKHLRWTVQLHVLDWTAREVCAATSGMLYPERQVQRAYKKMCDLLGLTPRKTKPGPRPGGASQRGRPAIPK